MGCFTKDPELKYTSTTNTAVCSFTLAVDKRFQKQGEERQADFISCQAWRQTSEFIQKHFCKGDMISIIGRIQTRTWDDADGKKHYVTEVIVDEAYFTGSKKNASEQNSGANRAFNADANIGDAGLTYQNEDDLPF